MLGYDAARQALNDPRLSKDMLAALQDNGDVVAEGLPGPEFSRHMLNVDPPDHTRLRRLVSRAFVPPRIAALESAIRAIASNLLDELDAAGPGATVDLIEGYAYPRACGSPPTATPWPGRTATASCCAASSRSPSSSIPAGCARSGR